MNRLFWENNLVSVILEIMGKVRQKQETFCINKYSITLPSIISLIDMTVAWGEDINVGYQLLSM